MGNQGVVQIDGQDVILFAGEIAEFTLPITVAAGSGVLKTGTVMARIDASRKYGPYANGGAGGLGTARVILAEDIDATDDDVNTSCYVDAVFNKAAL